MENVCHFRNEVTFRSDRGNTSQAAGEWGKVLLLSLIACVHSLRPTYGRREPTSAS